MAYRRNDRLVNYYKKLARSPWPGAVGCTLLLAVTICDLLVESRFSFTSLHVLAIILGTYAWGLRGFAPFALISLLATLLHNQITGRYPTAADSSVAWNGISLVALYLIVGGAVLVMRDAQRMIEQLAATDWLTGLANRRGFADRLAQETERCRRFNQPLTLLMLDVDNLKLVNDRYGHVAGDMVIALTARTLQERLRATDLAGRYGGDEFIVMLANTDIAGGQVLADTLRQAIDAALAEYAAGDEHKLATVSIGLAGWRPELVSSIELIAQADRALYLAKRAGKNRVGVAAQSASIHLPVVAEQVATYH